MTRTIIIHFTWDSGPHGVWYPSDRATPHLARHEPEKGYLWSDDSDLPIPVDVWERYERARAELSDAEEALDRAGREAREALL